MEIGKPMKNLLIVENNTVMLNSKFDETTFGKTKGSLLMKENGYIAEKNSSGEFSRFIAWNFTETKTIDEEVFFCGNFSLAKTVSQQLEDLKDFPTERKKILFDLCCAYDSAIENNIPLPCNGLDGILYSENSILFLPENLFERSCKACGKEFYNKTQNKWKNSILTGTAARRYIESNLAYFALSETSAYNFKTEEELSSAMSFNDFLPIEYRINGISDILAKSINSGIEGNFSQKEFPIDLLKTELFSTNQNKKLMSQKEFLKRQETFLQHQKNKIRRIKTIRKNKILYLSITFALLFFATSTWLIIHEQQKKPVILGLNSKETVEVFYKGLHNMDTEFMNLCAKNCIQAKRYTSSLPQIAIAESMRSAYNFDSGISTPENWLFFEPESSKQFSHRIFGITNFSIDGTKTELNITVPTRKNHPPVSQKYKSRKANFSEEENHTVHYFLVHTADNMINVDEYTTNVKLSWNKNVWQITELNETYASKKFFPADVAKDFKVQLDFCNGDVITATKLLRTKYEWLPTDNAVIAEKLRLDQRGY